MRRKRISSGIWYDLPLTSLLHARKGDCVKKISDVRRSRLRGAISNGQSGTRHLGKRPRRKLRISRRARTDDVSVD